MRGLLDCPDGSEGTLTDPVSAAEVDGVEVVDGLAALCVVDGVSAKKSAAAAQGCTDRVRQGLRR